MTPEEIAAAGGKKTISEFLEEAELLPDVWGRLHAYETDAGWHVMQDDPDGGRAVADCETMEIAKFLVCAPKAIIHLNQIVKDTSARAEAAEVALAAVPVEALKRTLLTGYRTDAQITADADAINAWLGEAQP